jgi:hypothetical protein
MHWAASQVSRIHRDHQISIGCCGIFAIPRIGLLTAAAAVVVFSSKKNKTTGDFDAVMATG